jgi:hypothetical protein
MRGKRRLDLIEELLPRVLRRERKVGPGGERRMQRPWKYLRTRTRYNLVLVAVEPMYVHVIKFVRFKPDPIQMLQKGKTMTFCYAMKLVVAELEGRDLEEI